MTTTTTTVSPVTVERARRVMGHPGETNVTPGPAQHIRYRNMLHAMMTDAGYTAPFTARDVVTFLGVSHPAMARMASSDTRNGDGRMRVIPVMTDPARARNGNGARPDGWARGRNACAIAHAYVSELRAAERFARTVAADTSANIAA